MLTLKREQVREVDRIAIDEYGIPGIVLMENAGRNAAQIILADAEARQGVAVVCGRGNNGGDGFVIARHLANAGVKVEVYLAAAASTLHGDAKTNAMIIEKMGLPRVAFDSPTAIASALPRLRSAAVIVDALLGTGFTSDVRAPLDRAIEAINDAPGKVFAIDVPSGLDCDTGRPTNATIRANETITFVAMKRGFTQPEAAAYTGRVRIVDIGAPAEIIERVHSSPSIDRRD